MSLTAAASPCEDEFLTEESRVADRPLTEGIIAEIIEPFIRNPQPFLDIPEVDLRNFRGSEMATNYLKMAHAGALMGQADRRLHEHDLILSGGGLCASTCVLNALATMIVPPEMGQVYYSHAPDMMRAMVRAYREYVHDLYRSAGWWGEMMAALDPVSGFSDARRGASTAIMLKTLQRITPGVGVRVHWDEPTIPLNIAGWSTMNTILLGKATLEDAGGPLPDDDGAGHAIVILKLDLFTQEIWVSDPNRPNQVYRERYHRTADGRIRFRSRISYSKSGFPCDFVLDGMHVLEKVVTIPGA